MVWLPSLLKHGGVRVPLCAGEIFFFRRIQWGGWNRSVPDTGEAAGACGFGKWLRGRGLVDQGGVGDDGTNGEEAGGSFAEIGLRVRSLYVEDAATPFGL